MFNQTSDHVQFFQQNNTWMHDKYKASDSCLQKQMSYRHKGSEKAHEPIHTLFTTVM